MYTLSVTSTLPRVADPRIDIRVVLAFFAIYVLWGATFLAIRVAVLEVPPFLMAGLRFFLAGSLLYGFMRMRGEPSPSPIEWRSIGLMALFMFVATYGALFWAEQYVPSGITSVIEATLPLTTLTLEVFVFRQQPLRWRMLGAVAVGFGGVVTLLVNNGERDFEVLPCLVILASGVAWSVDCRRRNDVGWYGAAGTLAAIRRSESIALHTRAGSPRLVVPDRRRFDDRLYGVRMAVGAHASHARCKPRLRESPGGPRVGIFRSGRGVERADHHRLRSDSAERLSDPAGWQRHCEIVKISRTATAGSDFFLGVSKITQH
jgi:hypothetical protein